MRFLRICLTAVSLCALFLTAKGLENPRVPARPLPGEKRFRAGILWNGRTCPSHVFLLERTLKGIQERNDRFDLIPSGAMDDPELRRSFDSIELDHLLRKKRPRFAWIVLVSPTDRIAFLREVPLRPIDQVPIGAALEKRIAELSR